MQTRSMLHNVPRFMTRPCSIRSLLHVQVLNCQLAAKEERHVDAVSTA